MTFYQELQLNQAGSKQLIKDVADYPEKLRHIAIYLFKIFLTLAFCMAFVIAYTTFFGHDNSIVGVVVLLFVMVFRNIDLGFHTPHAIPSLLGIFAILAFGFLNGIAISTVVSIAVLNNSPAITNPNLFQSVLCRRQ